MKHMPMKWSVMSKDTTWQMRVARNNLFSPHQAIYGFIVLFYNQKKTRDDGSSQLSSLSPKLFGIPSPRSTCKSE